MYKLVAIDIDGTLINDKKELTNEVKEALNQSVKKGVMIVLCSGRSPSTLDVIGSQFDFDMPFACYHGATIIKGKSKEVLYEKGLNPLDALKIAKECDKRGLGVNLWTFDGALWIMRHNSFTDLYMIDAHYKGEQKIISDELLDYPFGIGKILANGKEEEVTKILYEEAPIFTKGMAVDFYTSLPMFLEFVHNEAKKGDAIKNLATLNNIKQEEVIAMGDGLNDLSMIEYAGLGVAMENANEKVKKAAQVIAPSNNDNGVAYILNKYVLNKE